MNAMNENKTNKCYHFVFLHTNLENIQWHLVHGCVSIALPSAGTQKNIPTPIHKMQSEHLWNFQNWIVPLWYANTIQYFIEQQRASFYRIKLNEMTTLVISLSILDALTVPIFLGAITFAFA